MRESAILKTAGGNTMDWIKRLNQAIDFIEENLDGELDYEDVAGIAGCPSYYFQQMFLYMTDMTLREYIRRRRLSLSAVELQKGNGNVPDIEVYLHADPEDAVYEYWLPVR